MRAFMSEVGWRGTVESCDLCGAEIGPSDSYVWHLDHEDCRATRKPVTALAEARRILAETEPERDAEGWLTAHVPASFPEHGHTELAEALAAFVGDAQ